MKKYEWEPTKSSPGRWSWLLKDIAEAEGVSNEKIVTYPSIGHARKAKVRFHDMMLTINGNTIMPLRVEMKGNVKTLIFNTFELPVAEYNGIVKETVSKRLEDYTLRPKHLGSYKNCEGGGWYSMANLYEFNGVYFTDAY